MRYMLMTFLYLLIGIVSGAIDKWMDDPSEFIEAMVGHLLGYVGTYPGMWMFVLVLIAWLNRRSLRKALLCNTVYFLGLCIGYYLYSQLILGYSGIGVVVFWLAASVTIVPLFSALTVYSMGARQKSNILPAIAIGGMMTIPFAGAVGALLLANMSSPHFAVEITSSVVQIAFGLGIWMLLARTSRSKIISGVSAILLALPVFFSFDLLWEVMKSTSRLFTS